MKAVWAIACALILQCAGGAQAQDYPNRPITLIVPFAAGGPADTLARNLAERMRNSLGQSFVVENVGGAAGATGVTRLVRSPADGYTIGIGHLGTNVFNAALYDLGYDLINDLEPIAFLTNYHSVIAAKKDVPAKDLKEFAAWLKANPDQATSATAGIGSVGHLGVLHFQNLTGTTIRIIPYRGGAPALADVVAGHVTFVLNPVTSAADQTAGGRLKVLAVTAAKRLPALPDVPTVDEAGLPGMYVSTWFGLWAPKGTPKAIIAKLNAATIEAMNEPVLRKQLVDGAADLPSREEQTPEALLAYQKAEAAKWWPIIKSANIKTN